MDENDIQSLLEIYEWEKMDPKERWEQEEVKNIEKLIHEEQLALIQDDMEQDQQIEAIIRYLEEEQKELHCLYQSRTNHNFLSAFNLN